MEPMEKWVGSEWPVVFLKWQRKGLLEEKVLFTLITK